MANIDCYTQLEQTQFMEYLLENLENLKMYIYYALISHYYCKQPIKQLRHDAFHLGNMNLINMSFDMCQGRLICGYFHIEQGYYSYKGTSKQ